MDILKSKKSMYYSAINYIVFIFVLASCANNIKTQTGKNTVKNLQEDAVNVYRNGQKVSTFLNNTVGNCNDCYVYESLDVFNKTITFLVPVENSYGGKRFEKMLYFKKKETDGQMILEIRRRATYINGIQLYLSDQEEYVRIDSYFTYQSEDYRKKLSENDYEHVPALKMCTTSNYHYLIKDTINLFTTSIFNHEIDDCKYCFHEDENCEKYSE